MASPKTCDVVHEHVCCDRMVLLCLLIAYKKSVWMVEQPATSIMAFHPRWRWMQTSIMDVSDST